uniref:PDZ domain-containing protein n=1 Tax=Steinernema glaseri TaxID=37863 RepID=A0A1I7YZE3_9BILA
MLQEGPEGGKTLALGRAEDVVVLLDGVEEEGAEEAGVAVLRDLDQVVGVELEGRGVDQAHLEDAVEPLQEDGTLLVVRARRVEHRVPVVELVPEADPVPAHQQLEALQGTVVRVAQKLGQRHDLRRPVP